VLHRGTLRNFGLKVGMVGTVKFETRIKELVESSLIFELVEPLLIVRQTLREQIGILHRRLLAIVGNDDVCRRLMTVPGVGPVVALTYRATVDVPARFRNSKAVGAAFGLTPSQYQSGEINRTGAISKCGDEMMRVMLYEAAQIMLVRGEVVLAQSLGHEDRQAPRDEEGDRGAGAPVGGDHAPHLGGRHRVPRATSTPRVAESLKVLDSKRPIREADI
jgi:transposase